MTKREEGRTRRSESVAGQRSRLSPDDGAIDGAGGAGSGDDGVSGRLQVPPPALPEGPERTGERRGYRSGHYGRRLITRVGTLELRVPQDRAGEFSTEVFERYQRSEKALTAALFEMYVQGVSTRKVKAITEELCGHGFSASTVSAIVRKLDDSLAEFARRRLEQPFPYLIVDARYEKVREGGWGGGALSCVGS